MKKSITILILSIFSLGSIAQTSLDDCINNALSTHPALKNRESLVLINQNKLENNKIINFPNLSMGGQSRYQSDVVEFGFDLPFEAIDFPEVPHFQYSLSLDLKQNIYNGGRMKLQEELLLVQHQEEIVSLDAIVRNIKEKVMWLYLNILLKDKQLGVLELVQTSLDANLKRLRAAHTGGIATEVDIKVLEAEGIDIRRKVLSLRSGREAQIEQLELISKLDIGSDEIFIIPEADFFIQTPDRSEHQIFDFRNQELQIKKKIVGLKTTPRLSAFGQAGFGQPGLNVLSDQFQDFYVFGLQATWIPWDYKETKRNQMIIDLNARMLNNEREKFDLELQSAIDHVLNRINLLGLIIKEDTEMVSVREAIRLTMEKRLDEGVITSSDYISELNHEKQARLDLERSKLELLANQLAYLVIIGK